MLDKDIRRIVELRDWNEEDMKTCEYTVKGMTHSVNELWYIDKEMTETKRGWSKVKRKTTITVDGQCEKIPGNAGVKCRKGNTMAEYQEGQTI